MADLFDLVPAAGLADALALVDGADPDAAIWASMQEAGSGFGRAGGGGRFAIFGFGIEGRGASWDEAARQWVAGARAMLGEDG
jgi:hypothetical protein